jgi:multiple sugar transport system permease protein
MPSSHIPIKKQEEIMTVSTRSGPKKLSTPMSKEIKNTLLGLAFISPWLLGFLWLTLYPLVASLYYGFTEYAILSDPIWIGPQNFITMLTKDKFFWISVQNTLFFVVVSVPLGTIGSIAIALLLNNKVRFMSIYRTIYYVPTVVPVVATVLLWGWILNPQVGPLNYLLGLVGIKGPGWLADPNWSKPALIVISLWGLGASTVIYLAGLQDIPGHLYEAAELDGANWYQKIFKITLPLLSPTILFNIIMGLINGFQYFSQAFIGGAITGGNTEASMGPPLSSLLFYNLYLYRNAFGYFQMGYASAMAWLLLIFVLLLTLLLFKLTGRFVYYAR